VQVLEEDEVHDVINVRGEADVRRGRVEVLAEAAQGWPVDLPALGLEERSDLLHLPAAGPGAVDADKDGWLGDGWRWLSGGQEGGANESKEGEE